MSESLLPLFPLKVVLFPRTEIPLHIFEERYKEMIGECLKTRSVFGIVLLLEQGLASTGCTASIEQVIHRFDDGRMDILVRGQRRFDLTGLDQERSFLRGDAEFFDDDDDGVAASDPRRKQALELLEQLSPRTELEDATDPPLDPADRELSFQIASRFPVDLPFRQTLLQMRSESDRLDRVISYSKKLSLRLTRVAHLKAKAGNNGHGR
jgi:Lon protease-like protein